MVVVLRFRVAAERAEQFRGRIEAAHAALAAQDGYVAGQVGRNADDPDLWALVTRWQGPGAYRRALSSYDVRVRAWEALAGALDEPSAYVEVRPGDPLEEPRPRGGG